MTDIKQAGGSGATQPVTEQKVKVQYDEADRRTLLTVPNGSTVD